MSSVYLDSGKVASITLGATTLTNGVAYAAYKPVGSGPGGDLVSPRLVANVSNPVGATIHHSWWEIKVGIDEDVKTALITSNLLVPGTALSALVVTERATDGKTRTVTFSAGNCYTKNADGVRIESEGEHATFEVSFYSFAAPVFGAWA